MLVHRHTPRWSVRGWCVAHGRPTAQCCPVLHRRVGGQALHQLAHGCPTLSPASGVCVSVSAWAGETLHLANARPPPSTRASQDSVMPSPPPVSSGRQPLPTRAHTGGLLGRRPLLLLLHLALPPLAHVCHTPAGAANSTWAQRHRPAGRTPARWQYAGTGNLALSGAAEARQ